MSQEHEGIRDLLRGHYTWLLISLLAIYAVYPFLQVGTWTRSLSNFAFLGMMVAALLTVARRKTLVVVLLIPGLVSQLLSHGSAAGLIEPLLIEELSQVVFLSMTTVVILRDVLSARHVTMHTVFGACCTYLLMALTWASVYGLLEFLYPGSFSVSNPGPPDQIMTSPGTISAQLTYYSLITLTTVGYGDITPFTSAARALAALEGLIGQLYVAVIIARLVAIEVSDRMSRRS